MSDPASEQNCKHKSPFDPQTLKYLLITAATLLPIVSILLLVFLTSYRPVIHTLDRIMYETFNKAHPLHELQIALAKSVMPPNDYLIHGSADEKVEWDRLRATVEAKFDAVMAGLESEEEKQALLMIRAQWDEACLKGTRLFEFSVNSNVNQDAADAMEQFDAEVDVVTDKLYGLTQQINTRINRHYHEVPQQKFKGIAYTVAAIFLGLFLGGGYRQYSSGARPPQDGQTVPIRPPHRSLQPLRPRLRVGPPGQRPPALFDRVFHLVDGYRQVQTDQRPVRP
jgi:hypothetical protein